MDFPSFLNTIITVFILLIAGYVLGKMDVIDGIASKRLSKLIVTIAQPAMIISAITKQSYSQENLKLSLISLGLAFAVHIIMAIIAYFSCIKIKDLDERKITEFAMVFGNIGFLGIPLMESLYPKNGAFVASFFVVCFNILLWIIGLGIIARQRDDIKMTFKKIILNKGTVPSFIGYALFLIPAFIPSFDIPSFLSESVSYVSALCTPISMMIIGALLAHSKLSAMFRSPKVYYLCLFKLLVFPLIFCFLMKILGFSEFYIVFVAAISAMPAASSTSMFAELYDTAPEYSAQCVGVSTLISIATMPCMILLAQQISKLDIALFTLI